MSVLLNPRLTVEQALALRKQAMDGAVSLADKYHADLAKIKDPKHRELYQRHVFPIVMQQLAYAMTA